MPQLTFVLLTGAAVGFMGGLLGKGGSAIATPILAAVGVPPMVAVAAPLPATVPSTLVAAQEYRRRGMLDSRVLRWSIAAGLPATILGAILTRWISGEALVYVTELMIVALGVRLLVRTHADEVAGAEEVDAAAERRRTIAVAVIVGLAAGLLANSGGFLLAPLFITVLGVPVKPALGTSLAVAAALAIPGTAVHFALGHLDWLVVAVFALGSIPLSRLGARVALRIDAQRLERFYGVSLVLMGAGFLLEGLI